MLQDKIQCQLKLVRDEEIDALGEFNLEQIQMLAEAMDRKTTLCFQLSTTLIPNTSSLYCFKFDADNFQR